MSDSYKGLEDLRVNPYVTPQQELKTRAEFPCPICGERISIIFTGEEIKAMYKGYLEALRRGPPRV